MIGVAPTARAARQLRDTAAIPAETMHTLLLRLTRAGGFPARTVLVLDEASMAPTRLTARLFDLAEQAALKVIAVGDPGQLGSVEAGGWLTAITDKQPQATLATAIRQHDAAERDALQALHDGDPDAYLQHKRPHVTVHNREIDAIQVLVDQWRHARALHGPAHVAMIVRDNYTRELANRAARTHLKATGQLSADGVDIGGREYASGDRIIARRNDRHRDIDNGTLGTIIAIHACSRAMIIKTDTGHPRPIDFAYADEHLEHAYALTGHGAQGATFQWAGVIGRPGEFTREWAYTALSRARTHTTLHLIAEAHQRERERDEYAPPSPGRALAEIWDSLRLAMRSTETEVPASIHGLESPAAEPPTTRLTISDGGPSAPDRSGRGLCGAAAQAGSSLAFSDQPAASLDPGTPGSTATTGFANLPKPTLSQLKGLRQLRRLSNEQQGPSLRL